MSDSFTAENVHKRLEGVGTYIAGESMDQVKLMLEAEDAHEIHTDAKSVVTSCNRSRTGSTDRPLKTLMGTFFLSVEAGFSSYN